MHAVEKKNNGKIACLYQTLYMKHTVTCALTTLKKIPGAYSRFAFAQFATVLHFLVRIVRENALRIVICLVRLDFALLTYSGNQYTSLQQLAAPMERCAHDGGISFFFKEKYTYVKKGDKQ